ncbi:hypothetical protein B0H14DRAFT_2976370 [Mycena olivaceomarginata]|nr:hypothetical protein B0H14DRAFT_2976370 [Mycena olivaceomarginata]
MTSSDDAESSLPAAARPSSLTSASIPPTNNTSSHETGASATAFQSIATSTTTIDSNHILATSSAIMSSSSSITTPITEANTTLTTPLISTHPGANSIIALTSIESRASQRVDHSPGSKSRLPQALPSAFGSTSSEPTTTWSIDSAQGRLQTSSMEFESRKTPLPSSSMPSVAPISEPTNTVLRAPSRLTKILVGGLLGGIGLVLCVAYAVWWLHRRKRYRRGMKSLADFDMITTIDPLSEPSQLAGDAPFPPPYSEVT